MAFSDGSPNSGMAQEPGAIAWPSVSETLAGKPRSRRKLLLGSASGGPTWMTNGACEAGSATMVGATTMRGRSRRCAADHWAPPMPNAPSAKAMPSTVATALSQRDRCARHGTASVTTRARQGDGQAPARVAPDARRRKCWRADVRADGSASAGLLPERPLGPDPSVACCLASCSTRETAGTASPGPQGRRGRPCGSPAAGGPATFSIGAGCFAPAISFSFSSATPYLIHPGTLAARFTLFHFG